VTDRWRGRGIASLLLRRIAARAQAAGICCLTAQCLSSNTAILRLLSRLGTMTTILAGPGVVEIWIDLPPVSTISPR
jgi:RimJ/RimL family protein N-acetyltransferase